MIMATARRVILHMIPFAGYDRGLLSGIARYSQIHGPWAFYVAGDNPGVPLPVPESRSGDLAGLDFLWGSMGNRSFPDLRQWKATGIIGRIQTPRLARRISASPLPVIWIDLSAEQLARRKRGPMVSEIRADSHTAGRLAAEHFLERGFRNFAFCGYEGRLWSLRRQEGFCGRLGEAGFPCDVYEPPSPQRNLSWDLERPQVIAWLQSLPKPAAVMACNDNRGRHLLEAGHDANLKIPDELAVAGVDNDEMICNLSNPPLSSVALNLESAGYQAAEHLDALMDDPKLPPRQILVEARWMITRRSTDVFAVEDAHVAAALRFIRTHAQTPIDNDDVVAQSGVSRRNLEIRFLKNLGRSIRQEIQRVRLARTKQLLAETNLSAEKIAALAGFSSLAYLSGVFHREEGITLSQFRQKTTLP
jgi:LacI family transcriptional regulator